MVPLLLEEKDSPAGMQAVQKEENRESLRARRGVILGYLKSVGKEEDTSPEEKMEKLHYTWSSVTLPSIHMTGPTFYELVIRPVSWGWGTTVEATLTFEQEEQEEQEEYGVLHDYVLDDLSVDYNSAEEFHEYLMSLRRRYERARRSSRRVRKS